MGKVKIIITIGFILPFFGFSSPIPDLEVLYQTYLEACPPSCKITAYDLKYHGEITTKSRTYHFLGYSYAWEVGPQNHKGNGEILIYSDDFEFIGYFKVYGDPEVTISGKKWIYISRRD